MKLDKIKFAQLCMFIGRQLDMAELTELDHIVDIDVTPVEVPGKANPQDVNELMRIMASGGQVGSKIEAIKLYRQLTGCMLKESKDAVEKYWVSKPVIGWDIGKEGGDKTVAMVIEDSKIIIVKEGEEAIKLIEEAATISDKAWEEIKVPANSGVEIKASLTAEEAKTYKEIWENIPANKLILNKHPTHDPYTNPNAFLYYQCNCGQRLDPHVKSFAALNNAAMNAEWRIRWGNDSYVPYCPKCVEEKGIE